MREDINREELSTADLAKNADRSTSTDADRSERVLDREVRRDDGSGEPADMSDESRSTPLLRSELIEDFHARWTEIQAGFVDEPRRAVQDADGLVAEAIKQLAESFARERASLEGQWDRGDDVSTEDLRQALRRYRSFFSRLLSV